MLESYLLGLCLAAACPPVQGAPPIPPDPTLVGEYGSHKPKLAEGDLVGLDFMLLTDEEINRRFRIPEPGDTQSPWSHFLNPDHHGARDTLTVGSAPGDGSGAPSFGETAGLPFPYLLDLPATPPAAEFDSGWEHCGNWVAPKVYDRRRVVLPSGTGLYVFKPRTGHYVHPGAVGTDRVALILPMGYQGTNYSLNRGIEFEEPNPCVPEPFPSAPDCECSFGYQIVPNPTPVQVLMDENIIPDTPVYEALELGLTVVYVHFGTGRRNLYTHLAQMCEAASWLDSVDYQNPPGVPGTEPAVSHLKFTHGGSYMGGLAHTAAHFMPWIFAGAITMVGSEDIYGSFGSQIGTEAMTEQVTGQYRSGFVNVQRLSEDDLAFFSDGWRGYLPDAGDDYPGITGTPVDMAGLGMFTGALDFGLTTTQLPNLHVPIMIFRADVDQSQFTFYDDRHSAPPPTFLSELTSPPSGGQIIERRARRVEHDDGVAFREWNGEHRMLTDFVTNYLPTAAPARSAVTPKPTGEVEWRVRTMDSGGPLLDPEPREIMMEKPDTAWQASPSGIQAQVVSTPEWEALRYPTGIGAGDSLFWPGRDFIYGTTGLGEVVRMQVEYDGDRITEIALDERVSLGNHYGTAEMLSVSSTQAVALTQFGEVYDVDLANMTVAARSDRVGEILGRGLFRDGSDFGAVNEQGEVALFAKDVGASVDRWYLEGGAGPVSSTTSGYYYSSPDGNLKRTDLGHPDYNHPTVPDDISPHLYGHATHIIPIASGFLLYMPGGNRQLVQLSSSLDVVAKGDLVVEFSTGQGTKLFPDGLHVIESGGGSLPELLMWGLGNDEPRDQDFKRTSSKILRCTLGQTTGSDVDGVDTLAITAFSFVEVPGQVTSVIPSFDHESATIGWGGLADPPTNKARWLFALQDGRLGLIDDFGGTGSGVTRTYGKPIAASFGLMNLHEIPVVANTPGIQPWMHLVGHGDSQFVLEESHTAAPVLMNHGPVASLVNSFPVETEVDPPTRGAFLTVNPTPSNGGVGVRTVGFPDGGARYHVPGAAHEDVLAYPWTPPGGVLARCSRGADSHRRTGTRRNHRGTGLRGEMGFRWDREPRGHRSREHRGLLPRLLRKRL